MKIQLILSQIIIILFFSIHSFGIEATINDRLFTYRKDYETNNAPSLQNADSTRAEYNQSPETGNQCGVKPDKGRPMASTVKCPVNAVFLGEDSSKPRTVEFEKLDLLPPPNENGYGKQSLVLSCKLIQKCQARSTGAHDIDPPICANPADKYVSGCVALQGIIFNSEMSEEFDAIIDCPSDELWHYYLRLSGRATPENSSYTVQTIAGITTELKKMCEQFAIAEKIFELYENTNLCPNSGEDGKPVNMETIVERPGICCSYKRTNK